MSGLSPWKVALCLALPVVAVACVLMAIWSDENTARWVWTAVVVTIASLPGVIVLLYHTAQNVDPKL